jgi:hypothetical protein
VFATSPTLVTPVLGAATATSINFGQTTLNYYGEGTWTMSLGGTATYNERVATYTRIGRLCHLDGKINVNTLGTGSTTTISGAPFTNSTNDASGAISLWQNLPASYVYVNAAWGASATTIIFGGVGAAGASLSLPLTMFGNSAVVRFSVTSASVS